jgi:3-oxoacyl-[acyl-carrier protein] reductase
MHLSLTGKVAVVTGGANGIGRATVARLARSGAAVAIWDRDLAALGELIHTLRADGANVVATAVDVTDRAAIDRAVSEAVGHFGGIDILVNNAGITRDAQLVRVKDGVVTGGMSEADFDAVIAVNLKGVYACTQVVVPQLIARGGGAIVNATSVVARAGNFGQTNYVASKAGVIGMTQVWARELGRRGIRVNAIAPGFIATDMTRAMPESALEQMVAHTPLGAMGTPDDVAAAYCFLVSDAARFITGAVLAVDGGLVIGT